MYSGLLNHCLREATSALRQNKLACRIWQAKGDNIIKHSTFMDDINYCMGKLFLHWLIHFHMGKTMFAWANSLLHGQLHYCIGKSIIAWANLYCMGKFIEHGQSILYGLNYFAYATKDSFQNSSVPISCA